MKYLYDLQLILVTNLETENSNFGVNSNTTTGCSDHILKYSTCICLGDWCVSAYFLKEKAGKMSIHFSSCVWFTCV